jgi:hypothetical protein
MAELITIWQNPDAPTSKFFASVCMYRLSKVLDRKHFEPVMDGHLDLNDPASQQADLVVYDKHKLYRCVVLIHFTGEMITKTLIQGVVSQLQKYKIEEAFLYDLSNGDWLKVNANGNIIRDSYSASISTSLDEVLMVGLDSYRA